MSIAFWCVLVAGLLPLATVGIAKSKRGYDNNSPRAWLEKQEGFRRRADFAHRNHFEAFPFFAAGVIIAQQMQVAQHTVDTLAITFIVARIAYTVLYLVDRASLRSVAWFVGFSSVVILFLRAGQIG